MKKIFLLFVIALMVSNVSGQIVSSWKSKRVDPTSNKYYKIGTISLPSNYCMFNGTFYSSFQQIGSSMETSFIKYSISARNTNGDINLKIIHNGSSGKDDYSANVIGLINGTIIDIYAGGINASYQYPSHSLLGYSINVGGTFTKTENDEGTTTLPSGTQVTMNKSLFVEEVGNVGIGTVNPRGILHTKSNTYSYNSTNSAFDANLIIEATGSSRTIGQGAALGFVVPANTDGTNPWQHGRILVTPDNTTNIDASGRMYVQTRDLIEGAWEWRDNLVLRSSGRVGIGTENPQSLLAVNGTITSKEVKVTLDGWSDFVFNDDYKLIKLEKVEDYIISNKRLPEMPSENEVIENGVNLGEMDAKLLQKIEELTLYMIEINKEVKTLKQENADLKEEIQEMKSVQ